MVGGRMRKMEGGKEEGGVLVVWGWGDEKLG